MENNQTILKVKGLCKYFPVYSQGFIKKAENIIKVVDDVSFELKQGRTLGLAGESGCGKTTTCRTILHAIKPTAGQVLLRTNNEFVDISKLKSRQLRPLRQKIQMVFQDPFSSLNPRMTIGNIIAEPLIIHKIAKVSEIKRKIAEILLKVGLKPEHSTRYPHAFSGGQRQRIGIARALIMKPSVIICDEAVSALDVSVQAQVINLLEDLQDEFKLTYLFVAHDLSVVQHICDEVAIMYAGKIVESGKTENIFMQPKHPYTKALLSAVPYPDPDRKIKFVSSGEPADLANLPRGCSFAPRCTKKFGLCLKQKPDFINVCQDQYVACHLYKNENKTKN